MKARTCGFRFSKRDGLILALTAAATGGLWPLLGEAILPLPIVVGHFFLFCNVFRVHRRLEYGWGAAFVLNAAITIAWLGHSWWIALLVQLPLTAFLIGWEMAQPRYHGIGARRVNSRHIDRYLRGEV